MTQHEHFGSCFFEIQSLFIGDIDSWQKKTDAIQMEILRNIDTSFTFHPLLIVHRTKNACFDSKLLNFMQSIAVLTYIKLLKKIRIIIKTNTQFTHCFLIYKS